MRAREVYADNIPELLVQANELPYQNNIRASAEYRRMLSGVLIQRAADELERIGTNGN